MASLSGNSIDTTYPSLLKTTDNSAIGATEKNITDGAGNASTLALGTVSASFTGTLDLSGATVTGLPGGAPGLVNGTGASSLQSAAALTTTPANASGNNSIALGNGADSLAAGGIAIGDNSITQNTSNGISIGTDASTNWGQQIAIGQGATANAIGAGAVMALGAFANCAANNSIAMGYIAAVSGGGNALAIGAVAKARATNSTALGYNAINDDAVRVNTVMLGSNTKAAQYSTALGSDAFAIGMSCIAIGDAVAAGNYAIAIGDQANANFNNTVAIGNNVSAVNWTDSTTLAKLAITNYATIDYADDTAAAAGGVPLGGVYHTSGVLKIRVV